MSNNVGWINLVSIVIPECITCHHGFGHTADRLPGVGVPQLCCAGAHGAQLQGLQVRNDVLWLPECCLTIQCSVGLHHGWSLDLDGWT